MSANATNLLCIISQLQLVMWKLSGNGNSSLKASRDCHLRANPEIKRAQPQIWQIPFSALAIAIPSGFFNPGISELPE